MAQYNFLDSLKRIEALLQTDSDTNQLPSIPRKEELLEDKTIAVKATVMSIKIATYYNVEGYSSSSLELPLQAFLTEVFSICHSNEKCRDIILIQGFVFVIFSTPQKSDVDSVIDEAARIRSLAMVLNKKATSINIDPTIGVDYGKLLVSALITETEGKKLVWSGPAIDGAQNLAENNIKGSVAISSIIWNNIKKENQRLFKRNSILDNYYVGSIINVIMNNWVLSND